MISGGLLWLGVVRLVMADFLGLVFGFGFCDGVL